MFLIKFTQIKMILPAYSSYVYTMFSFVVFISPFPFSIHKRKFKCNLNYEELPSNIITPTREILLGLGFLMCNVYVTAIGANTVVTADLEVTS